MSHKNNTVFFMCSGLGLGNSSRTSAVIEEVMEKMPEIKVYVFTWGKGIDFFKQGKKVQSLSIVELAPYSNSSNPKSCSYLQTMLKALLKSPYTYYLNSKKILNLARNYSPDLVVFDSDYHFLPFIISRKPVLVSINQSFNVISSYFSFGIKKKIETFPSLVIELMDAFLQLIFTDKIYVPTINRPVAYLFKKVTPTPLIVRKVFLQENVAKNLKPLGVCLSGSGLESKRIMEWARKEGGEILKVEEDKLHSHVFPQPKILSYRRIACQGGLSTVSEVLGAGREITVLPISGHCEQYSNFFDVKKISLKKEYSENIENFLGSRVIADEILAHIDPQAP